MTTKQPTMEPLGDRILVRLVSEEVREEKTKSGIIIPVTVSGDKGGNAKRGTVVAVGPGRLTDEGKRIAISVKKNDTVLFQWGDEVMIDGAKHYIVREEGVLAVVK